MDVNVSGGVEEDPRGKQEMTECMEEQDVEDPDRGRPSTPSLSAFPNIFTP